VVQRFEGHIAPLLGDVLLVYFGWPQAVIKTMRPSTIVSRKCALRIPVFVLFVELSWYNIR
jgi:hypothetical protein